MVEIIPEPEDGTNILYYGSLPALQLTPSSLRFDALPLRAEAAQEFRLQNISNRPLKIRCSIRASEASSGIQLSTQGTVTLPAGLTSALTVTATGTGTDQDASIYVQCYCDAHGMVVGDVPVHVSPTFPLDELKFNSAVDFGVLLAENRPVERSVAITNTAQTAVVVDFAQPPPPPPDEASPAPAPAALVRPSSLQLAPGETRSVTVQAMSRLPGLLRAISHVTYHPITSGVTFASTPVPAGILDITASFVAPALTVSQVTPGGLVPAAQVLGTVTPGSNGMVRTTKLVVAHATPTEDTVSISVRPANAAHDDDPLVGVPVGAGVAVHLPQQRGGAGARVTVTPAAAVVGPYSQTDVTVETVVLLPPHLMERVARICSSRAAPAATSDLNTLLGHIEPIVYRVDVDSSTCTATTDVMLRPAVPAVATSVEGGTLRHGAAVLGIPERRTIVITNISTTVTCSLRIDVLGVGFRARPAPLPHTPPAPAVRLIELQNMGPGESYHLEVEFAPSVLGPHTGSLLLTPAPAGRPTPAPAPRPGSRPETDAATSAVYATELQLVGTCVAVGSELQAAGEARARRADAAAGEDRGDIGDMTLLELTSATAATRIACAKWRETTAAAAAGDAAAKVALGASVAGGMLTRNDLRTMTGAEVTAVAKAAAAAAARGAAPARATRAAQNFVEADPETGLVPPSIEVPPAEFDPTAIKSTKPAGQSTGVRRPPGLARTLPLITAKFPASPETATDAAAVARSLGGDLEKIKTGPRSMEFGDITVGCNVVRSFNVLNGTTQPVIVELRYGDAAANGLVRSQSTFSLHAPMSSPGTASAPEVALALPPPQVIPAGCIAGFNLALSAIRAGSPATGTTANVPTSVFVNGTYLCTVSTTAVPTPAVVRVRGARRLQAKIAFQLQGPTSTVTHQIVLENPCNGEVRFRVVPSAAGGRAAGGIPEAARGTADLGRRELVDAAAAAAAAAAARRARARGRNTTGTPLAITRPTPAPAQPDFSVTPSAGMIPPGGTRLLTVTWHPGSRPLVLYNAVIRADGGRAEDSTKLVLQATLPPASVSIVGATELTEDEKSTTRRETLTGVHQPHEVQDMMLELGMAPLNLPTERQIILRNNRSNRSHYALSWVNDSSVFSVARMSGSIPGDSTQVLAVTVNASAPGVYTAVLLVSVFGRAPIRLHMRITIRRPQLEVTYLDSNGSTIEPRLTGDVPTIDYGAQPRGLGIMRYIRIRNTGDIAGVAFIELRPQNENSADSAAFSIPQSGLPSAVVACTAMERARIMGRVPASQHTDDDDDDLDDSSSDDYEPTTLLDAAIEGVFTMFDDTPEHIGELTTCATNSVSPQLALSRTSLVEVRLEPGTYADVPCLFSPAIPHEAAAAVRAAEEEIETQLTEAVIPRTARTGTSLTLSPTRSRSAACTRPVDIISECIILVPGSEAENGSMVYLSARALPAAMAVAPLSVQFNARPALSSAGRLRTAANVASIRVTNLGNDPQHWALVLFVTPPPGTSLADAADLLTPMFSAFPLSGVLAPSANMLAPEERVTIMRSRPLSAVSSTSGSNALVVNTEQPPANSSTAVITVSFSPYAGMYGDAVNAELALIHGSDLASFAVDESSLTRRISAGRLLGMPDISAVSAPYSQTGSICRDNSILVLPLPATDTIPTGAIRISLQGRGVAPHISALNTVVGLPPVPVGGAVAAPFFIYNLGFPSITLELEIAAPADTASMQPSSSRAGVFSRPGTRGREAAATPTVSVPAMAVFARTPSMDATARVLPGIVAVAAPPDMEPTERAGYTFEIRVYNALAGETRNSSAGEARTPLAIITVSGIIGTPCPGMVASRPYELPHVDPMARLPALLAADAQTTTRGPVSLSDSVRALGQLSFLKPNRILKSLMHSAASLLHDGVPTSPAYVGVHPPAHEVALRAAASRVTSGSPGALCTVSTALPSIPSCTHMTCQQAAAFRDFTMRVVSAVLGRDAVSSFADCFVEVTHTLAPDADWLMVHAGFARWRRFASTLLSLPLPPLVHETGQNRIDGLLHEIENMLNILKQRGCVLSDVRPDSLLSMNDFTAYHHRYLSASISGHTGDTDSSAPAPATLELLNAYWHNLSAPAWMRVMEELFYVSLVKRATPQAYRSIDSPTDTTQSRTDGLLPASATPAAVLTAWLVRHLKMVFDGQADHALNHVDNSRFMASDLSMIGLAAVLISYSPCAPPELLAAAERELVDIVDDSSSTDRSSHQQRRSMQQVSDLVAKGFTALGLGIDISATHVTSPQTRLVIAAMMFTGMPLFMPRANISLVARVNDTSSRTITINNTTTTEVTYTVEVAAPSATAASAVAADARGSETATSRGTVRDDPYYAMLMAAETAPWSVFRVTSAAAMECLPVGGALGNQLTVRVPANGSTQINVQFTPKFIRAVSARLTFLPSTATATGALTLFSTVQRDTGSAINLNGRPVVLTLTGEAEGARPCETIAVRSEVCAAKTIPIKLSNAGSVPLKYTVFIEQTWACSLEALAECKADNTKLPETPAPSIVVDSFSLMSSPKLVIQSTALAAGSSATSLLAAGGAAAAHPYVARITIQPGTAETFDVRFLPIICGVYSARVICVDPTAGQIVYHIIGSGHPVGRLPSSVPASTPPAIHFMCMAGDPSQQTITIPARSPLLNAALMALKPSTACPVEPAGLETLNAKLREGPIRYRVICNSHIVHAPKFVDIGPVRGSSLAADGTNSPSGPSLGDGRHQPGDGKLVLNLLARDPVLHTTTIRLVSPFDTRVFRLEVRVSARAPIIPLTFTCPARGAPVVQRIPVRNHGAVAATYSLSLMQQYTHPSPEVQSAALTVDDETIGAPVVAGTCTAFSATPAALTVAPGDTDYVTVTFEPTWACQVAADIVITDAGAAVSTIRMMGYATGPDPCAEVVVDVQARAPAQARVSCRSPSRELTGRCRVLLLDLPCVTAPEEIMIQSNGQINIPLLATPRLCGTYRGAVVVTSPSGQTYAWASVTLQVAPPPPAGVLSWEVPARSTKDFTVQIENTEDEDTTFNVHFASSSGVRLPLVGATSISVPAHSTADYTITYCPTVATEDRPIEAKVFFSSATAGDYSWTLLLSATPPPPIDIGEVAVEIGLSHVTQYTIENATASECIATWRSSDPVALAVGAPFEDGVKVTKLPVGMTIIEIIARPTAIVQRQPSQLEIRSNAGVWVFHAQLTGLAPKMTTPIVVCAPPGDTSDVLIPFTNPLLTPIRLGIELDTAQTTGLRRPISGISGTTSQQSTFKLVSNPTFVLAPGESTRLAVLFTAQSLQQHTAVLRAYAIPAPPGAVPVSVSALTPGAIVWQWSLVGRVEAPPPASILRLTATARAQPVERTVRLTLRGVTMADIHSATCGPRAMALPPVAEAETPVVQETVREYGGTARGADCYTIELSVDPDTLHSTRVSPVRPSRVLATIDVPSPRFSLTDARPVPSGDGVIIEVPLRFAPNRPFVCSGTLRLRHTASGASWRFTTSMEALQPAPLSTISVAATPGQVGAATVVMRNITREYAPYTAFFDATSSPTFSVAPATGVLEPAAAEHATRLTVTYRPPAGAGGPSATGHLVVLSEDVMYLYNVVGTLPEYIPPTVSAKVSTRRPK